MVRGKDRDPPTPTPLPLGRQRGRTGSLQGAPVPALTASRAPTDGDGRPGLPVLRVAEGSAGDGAALERELAGYPRQGLSLPGLQASAVPRRAAPRRPPELGLLSAAGWPGRWR